MLYACICKGRSYKILELKWIDQVENDSHSYHQEDSVS